MPAEYGSIPIQSLPHANTTGQTPTDHRTDAEVLAVIEAEAELTIQGQITFPAVQSAAAGVNVLDDYEEGTWTPGIADLTRDGSGEGQSYTIQVGRYTKIGNRVFVSGQVAINSLGTLTTSENAIITGLPFTPINVANARGGVTITAGSSLGLAAVTKVSGLILPNDNSIILLVWEEVAGSTNLLVSEVSVGGTFSFSGNFEVDS